jgi:hypothetical protein
VQRACGTAASGHYSPDQRPKRFSVLRVSMVRMELCSTRTMGRSAWSGIVRVLAKEDVRKVASGGGGFAVVIVGVVVGVDW